MGQNPLKMVRRMASREEYTKKDIRRFLQDFCPPEPESDEKDIKIKTERNSDGEVQRGKIHDWSKYGETPIGDFLPPGYRVVSVIDVEDPDELSNEVEILFSNPWVSAE